jgi:AAA15 family ATPase/GTPase
MELLVRFVIIKTMLTKITLENFKVFRHVTEFPLAKINLLTGINGRGKSSLLQSLLLMRQSIEHNENTTELILNGNCVHLGTWEDVKNKNI